jgi:biopolymer transport protein ExbB
MVYLNIQEVLLQTPITESDSVDNVAELLMKGGFIMIPIILLSLLSIYIFIERFNYIRKNSIVDQTLVKNIINEIRSKQTGSALLKAKQSNTSMGRILESGLNQTERSPKELEGYMESTANLEIAMMEKDTGYLGIIAGIAPMLGFIGTISGVIKIFYNISLADNISIGIIAGGLYQKMICSGTGLICRCDSLCLLSLSSYDDRPVLDKYAKRIK